MSGGTSDIELQLQIIPTVGKEGKQLQIGERPQTALHNISKYPTEEFPNGKIVDEDNEKLIQHIPSMMIPR